MLSSTCPWADGLRWLVRDSLSLTASLIFSVFTSILERVPIRIELVNLIGSVSGCLNLDHRLRSSTSRSLGRTQKYNRNQLDLLNPCSVNHRFSPQGHRVSLKTFKTPLRCHQTHTTCSIIRTQSITLIHIENILYLIINLFDY